MSAAWKSRRLRSRSATGSLSAERLQRHRKQPDQLRPIDANRNYPDRRDARGRLYRPQFHVAGSGVLRGRLDLSFQFLTEPLVNGHRARAVLHPHFEIDAPVHEAAESRLAPPRQPLVACSLGGFHPSLFGVLDGGSVAVAGLRPEERGGEEHPADHTAGEASTSSERNSLCEHAPPGPACPSPEPLPYGTSRRSSAVRACRKGRTDAAVRW